MSVSPSEGTAAPRCVPPTAREKVAVFLTGFAAFLTLYAPQPVLPQMSQDLGVSAAAVGSVIAATTLAAAAAAPIAGPLVDRYGRKQAVVVALLLLVPLSLLLAVCGTLTQVLLVRFVQGAVLPAVFTGATAAITGRWSGPASAVGMGIYVSGSVSGGFAGRFLSGASTELLGWQGSFAVLAAVLLLCIPLVQLWLPADDSHRDNRIFSHFEAMGRLLGDPRLRAACLYGAISQFSMTGTLSYVGFRLAGAPFHLNAADVGLVFLIYPIGATLVPFNGRLLQWFGSRGALGSSLAVCAIGQAALLVPNLAVTTIGIGVFVTGLFLSQSLALGFVGRMSGQSKGAAAGLYVASYYIGGSVGSIGCGLAWETAGWNGCALLVLAALAIGTIASMAMRDTPVQSSRPAIA